jgi:glycosyltransferase involved in cell wall biosynthesis
MTQEVADRAYTYTVYTGTRNRAHTLELPYKSLTDQTFRDFEGLIIDNDSTDGTAELVERWQAEADFPIRYIRHANRGHHGSSNRAVEEARGELFLTLDSDDGCVPTALERFKAIWDGIADDRRQQYSAVTALCVDENGNPIGTRFPRDPTDSNDTEIRYRYRVLGEKWGFQRTDVMREFPYPTVPGYLGVMPSSIIWGAIGQKYLTRYVNEYLGIVRVRGADTLTTSGLSDLKGTAIGSMMDHRAKFDGNFKYFRYDPVAYFLQAANYARSSFWAGQNILDQARSIERLPARVLWLAALPLGIAAYLVDRGRRARLRGGAA